MDTLLPIAYCNIDDEHYNEAFQATDEIRRDEIPLTRFYITGYIFDETVSFVERVLDRHELAIHVEEAL